MMLIENEVQWEWDEHLVFIQGVSTNPGMPGDAEVGEERGY